MDLKPGDKLGPYEILSPIGAGGMGQVWRARDPRLQRDVAVKVSTGPFNDRFGREALAIAALNHSHICQVYDVGPNYLVMELIEGTPLKGPLAADQAIRYALQICGALETAHAKNITHRDLKPANIMVTACGVKLLDFGLAKMAKTGPDEATQDATQTMGLTEPGMVMGTAAYMSPEQARGETVDTRSDIFSFGVVLYEMLSGRRAFARGSLAETLSAILLHEPAPLDGPPDVAAVVARCLSKSPEDRFQTMSEVRAALEDPGGGWTGRHEPEKRVPKEVPSIAVLPFANIGADKENEYFSDGLAEEILNLLARIPGLKVIARTSSFAFRGKEQDIARIGEALRVKNILDGSVRRSGNRIRVTAQLIDATEGAHIWSERYDRDMTDVFAIQDEIGQAISEALKVRLAPRTRVMNVEAWEHWLKGVHYRARNTPENVAKAKEHFERALAIDPDHAQAHSGLALCCYVLGLIGGRPASETRLLANRAAERALEIDPADSESHAVLAMTAGVFDYDWERASKHHLRSVTCENVSPRAHFCYGFHLLLATGRAAESIEQSRMALQADPLSLLFHSGLVWCLICAGQHAEAIAAARRALEIGPNFHLLLFALGIAQLSVGLAEEAVHSFRRAGETAPWHRESPGCLAAAHHVAGDHGRAGELARQFPRPDGLNYGHAVYYACAGDTDGMFEALESAYQRRELHMLSLRRVVFFVPYHGDPRFQSLLRKMNLA